MAKPKTNAEGYLAVISMLEKHGHRFPKAALAKMLGLPRQSVSQWNNIVPESQALKVSILLGIPIESIRPETVVEATRLRNEHAKAKG